MKNPFRREKKALTASAEVVSAIRDTGWTAWPLLGSGSAQRVQDIFNTAQSADYAWLYTKSPAVRTVVDVLVRNIGQLELRLYEEVSASERRPRPDHAAALSMRYPNERTTGDKLVREMVKDYLIYDNSYALLLPAPDKQVGIVHIPAYQVEVQGSSLFRAENYRVWTQGAWSAAGTWGGAGVYRDFKPENILHWHGEHPMDPRVGLSRLDTLRDVIAEDAALAQAIVELASNNMQAPIWVQRPLEAPEMTADTLKRHEEDIANRLRARNRRPPVMVEGETLQSFAVSPQDAQMMEVRRWAIQRVAAVFGMPLGEVGLPDDASSQDRFYADCLPPYCEDFTRFLNQRVLVQIYDWPEGVWEFDLDKKTGWAMLPSLVAATGRPIMLTNEGRAKLNLPPVKGGDELVTPQNVTQGENPKPSPAVMGPQDPNKPPQDGSYRTDQGPTPLPSGNTGSGTSAKPSSGQIAAGKARDELEAKRAARREAKMPNFHPTRSADKLRSDEAVVRFEKALTRYFSDLEPKLKATSPQRKAQGRKANSDWTHWTAELVAVIGRVLRDVIGREGRRYAPRFGGGFDMGRTRNYRQAVAEGSAQQIMETIRAETSEQGLDQALGRLPQHAASAGSSLGVKSTTFARQEAARQSPDGIEGRVEAWIADTERHRALDGKTVPVGDTWEGGLRPGSAPGCKCTSTVY